MACESNLQHWYRCALPLSAAVLLLLSAATHSGAADAKRWKDDELVASYRDLVSSGGLEEAVRSPALPKDAPQPMFLEALAWYAAGTPSSAGVLTDAKLDERIAEEVRSYMSLLKAKVEKGEQNDYPRTRTWKLIQKYTVLRSHLSKPENNGGYKFRVMSGTAAADLDAWDRGHTLRSADEMAEKVCRASQDRPVLVKYGNTNCTQCMLFEILGTIRTFAENPSHKGRVDVYKVWWGYQPDASFAGRIKDPQRLDELAKAEGVSSSPFFIVYRNGRRYPCGDAFPDDNGRDDRLDSCLKQPFGEASVASFCQAPEEAGRPKASRR